MTVEAAYTPEAQTNGYGGKSGDIDPLFCKDEFAAIGKLCMTWPAQASSLKIDAASECNKIETTLYAPVDQVQNAIMIGLMKELGMTDLWVDVERTANGWYSKGKLLTEFESDWAEGEPSNDQSDQLQCAVVSASVGYKMKSVSCMEEYPSYCMAIRPNCPQGYTWLALFGNGTSCFKITSPTLEANIYNENDTRTEVTIAEHYCLKDKTRLAVPTDLDQRNALKSWYSTLEPAGVNVRNS